MVQLFLKKLKRYSVKSLSLASVSSLPRSQLTFRKLLLAFLCSSAVYVTQLTRLGIHNSPLWVEKVAISILL